MKIFAFVSALAFFGVLSAANAICPYTFDETSIAAGKLASPGPVMNNFRYILNCPSFTGNVAISSAVSSELLTMNQVGSVSSNIKQGAYAYLGSDYSGWTTILGWNVRAKHGAYTGMELGSTYTSRGASAIRLRYDAIEFHSASASAISALTEGSVFDFPKMVIDGQGHVGIGTMSPAALLDVNGRVHATEFDNTSDQRLKTDIEPLASDVLAKLMALRPVTFRWKTPKDDGMKALQIGLIAQEVERVLPSTVTTAHDAMKTKGIKYNELTTVLIKAVQEQQSEISALWTQNAKQLAVVQRQAKQILELKNQNRSFAERLDRLERIRLAGAR